jgi:hypothetical protein
LYKYVWFVQRKSVMNRHYRTSIDAVTLSAGRIGRYLLLCWDFSDW